VANAGTTDIKFMELIIRPSEDFELIGTSNYFYIGDVDSDDTESEELTVHINDVENLVIPVELRYKDANNQAYTVNHDLTMQLYSNRELKKFGQVETSLAGLWFILLILIVVAYIIYKKKPEFYKKIWRRVRHT
jgi:hypothetical protein